jgi:mono/diheme cytochrome c family protein
MRKTMIMLLAAATSTVAVIAADLNAGHAAYDKACKSCHGPTGAPNPAVAKSMKVEMRDLKSPEVQSKSDADLKKAITEGFGKMRAVKTIPGATADDVVAYIRSLKK